MDLTFLKKVLAAHKKWKESNGGKGKRADLWRADLQRADLWGADLRGADLRRADLRGANLRGANLQGADLWRANIQGADLWRADLQGADLIEADLQGADLQGAYLHLFDILKIKINGSDDLILELMRWDAEICGNEKMQAWVDGGDCPFDANISRLFFFDENRGLWKKGEKKCKNLLELWKWVAKEMNIKLGD
ncbi:MAG: pentapeptide repeat-containing protein [Candidatus Hodarchaeota archaeon]